MSKKKTVSLADIELLFCAHKKKYSSLVKKCKKKDAKKLSLEKWQNWYDKIKNLNTDEDMPLSSFKFYGDSCALCKFYTGRVTCPISINGPCKGLCIDEFGELVRSSTWDQYVENVKKMLAVLKRRLK